LVTFAFTMPTYEGIQRCRYRLMMGYEDSSLAVSLGMSGDESDDFGGGDFGLVATGGAFGGQGRGPNSRRSAWARPSEEERSGNDLRSDVGNRCQTTSSRPTVPESGCRRLRLTRSGLWGFKSSTWYCAKTWLNTGRTLSIDSFQAALHQLELKVDNLTTNTAQQQTDLSRGMSGVPDVQRHYTAVNLGLRVPSGERRVE
jgi:hypothetical protein